MVGISKDDLGVNDINQFIGESVFTIPCVPTGIKIGVGMSP